MDGPAQSPVDLAEEIGKRRPFDSLGEEAYLNLQRTAGLLAAVTELTIKRLSNDVLSSPLYNILRILRGAELESPPDDAPGLPIGDIAQQMVTRQPDMTRLINRLEAVGLCTRSRQSTDRRVVRILLTDAGRDMTERLRQPLKEMHENTLSHLANPTLRQFNDLLFQARHGPKPLG